ncbi:hypothetical protein QBC47DRAFT_388978 [Echria macrotheca]|uniref:DUF7907 domain-containing protein n=1 Tax=Echria macrotheca TaxID=438768 RepID=A0AAJ0B6J6_9PEZI|nr:hypothetical protein QBC47DRAFT_388978 [Echria macrotheca]
MFSPVLFALASLTAASPLATRDWQPGNYPPYNVIGASGITLVANLSNPTTAIFDPPVHGWTLSSVHVGAGLNAAILDPSHGHVFFVNGSGPEISGEATSLNLPPFNSTSGPVPQGLVYSQAEDKSKGYLSVNFGYGTKGFGIRAGLRSQYPVLFNPTGHTEFMVCNVSVPVYGRPQYPVFVVEEHAAVPDNCALMHLLPQCASIEEPLLGGEEFGWQPVGASCYPDVKALDWQKYSDPVYWGSA